MSTFDRNNIKPGIVHFGVGNFHRAHLESYTDRLIREGGHDDWGVCGAMILPHDERLYNALKSQEGRYTLTAFAPNGDVRTGYIDSLVNVFWGIKERESILSLVASPQIKIITLTITEGGYDIETENVKHDIANPLEPLTAFGYIAEGLRRRMAAGHPVTILSCDNLQHNGKVAQNAFMTFFERQDPELALWAKDNVTFPSCMVDRITPATRPEDVERLNALNGTDDMAPVYCEDFIQWVVEDNFIAGRPAWERVGVQFTSDVSPYENIKLSLLNASHTLLSYPSALLGHVKVDAAMADERIARLVREFMDIDITPLVAVPEDVNIEDYKDSLMSRFANPAISDQVSRLCGDGLSKFTVYVVPNLKRMLAEGRYIDRLAFLLAAYRKYLRGSVFDSKYEIFEPCMTTEDKVMICSSDPLDFFELQPFKEIGLKNFPAFVEKYLIYTRLDVSDALIG